MIIRPALFERASKLEWQRGQRKPLTASPEGIRSGRSQLGQAVRTTSALVFERIGNVVIGEKSMCSVKV